MMRITTLLSVVASVLLCCCSSPMNSKQTQELGASTRQILLSANEEITAELFISVERLCVASDLAYQRANETLNDDSTKVKFITSQLRQPFIDFYTNWGMLNSNNSLLDNPDWMLGSNGFRKRFVQLGMTLDGYNRKRCLELSIAMVDDASESFVLNMLVHIRENPNMTCSDYTRNFCYNQIPKTDE